MTAPRHDPGLQPQRTALAWRRTALTAAVAGLLCLRVWVVDPTIWMLFAIAAMVAVMVLTTIGQIERLRRCRRNPADPRPISPLLVIGTSALIAVAALCIGIGMIAEIRT